MTFAPDDFRYPMPTASIFVDPVQWVPLLLAAVDAALGRPDVWPSGQSDTALQLVEDLKAWVMFMSGLELTGNLTISGASEIIGPVSINGQVSVFGDYSHFVERTTTNASNLNLVLDTKNAGAAGTRLVGRKARNVSSESFPPAQGDELIALDGRGGNGTGYTATRALLFLRASQAWTATANGTELVVQLTPSGGTSMNTVLRLGGARPVVTGARGGNAALASLLAALASLELITNNTTA